MIFIIQEKKQEMNKTTITGGRKVTESIVMKEHLKTYR